MPHSDSHHDVVIVGGSLAGCTAATLFAQEGLRVALVERSPDVRAYKKICTHFIQSSAIPVMERLGLPAHLARAGGLRNGVQIWTRWGWIRSDDLPGDPKPLALSVRRQTLDPLLRTMETPGVDYYPGESARALLRKRGRVEGVELERADGRTREVRGRVVVAADGRDSRLAELAGITAASNPQARFAYFAHFTGVQLQSGPDAQMWFREPDIAYAFPNDGGVTVLACMPHRDRLPEFKRDLQRNFADSFRQLPDGPDLSGADRVTPIMGSIDLRNVSRPAAAPGLALIGDAALTSDPLWGVGCGWAFQSAAWLVEDTHEALSHGDPAGVDRALARYSRRHRGQLAGHHRLICDFSSGRPFNAVERLFFSAATADPVTARHFEAFGSRRISPAQFLGPRALLRAALFNLRRLGRRTVDKRRLGARFVTRP